MMVESIDITWVGVDWGDGKHSYVVEASGNRAGSIGEFQADPESVHGWAQRLRASCPGKAVVAVEQSRGALIYALQQYDFIEIVPVNPRAAKAYRESRYLSGAKDDPVDAQLLCDFVRRHYSELRPWRADDALTRELRLLVEGRRTIVDHRTSVGQALTATLKQYFPQILAWFGGVDSKAGRAFLHRWPTLELAVAARPDSIRTVVRSHGRMKAERLSALVEQIRSAVPLTTDASIIEPLKLLALTYARMLDTLDESIAGFDAQIATLWTGHPDAQVFESFPGAGAVMAPRLAVAFGRDRERFSGPEDLQRYSGIAPVIERSGKQVWTHARFRCPKFLKQTFHEFAAASLPQSPWALAFYRRQRERGAGHHAAIRSLAFRWIRVLYHCWSHQVPYNESAHVDRLRARNSPTATRLVA